MAGYYGTRVTKAIAMHPVATWSRILKPVISRYLRIPFGAKLRDSFLGFVVHIVKPETFCETVGPTEVIHQGPAEVSSYWNPFCSGAMNTSQVLTDVAQACLIHYFGAADGH